MTGDRRLLDRPDPASFDGLLAVLLLVAVTLGVAWIIVREIVRR